MDSDLAQALVAAAIWVVVLVAVRTSLRHVFDRYERRLAERDPAVAARRRTTFSFLLRVAIALVGLVGAWSVLSAFDATQQIASAFLASSAVLAVIAGLALTTPLGNLGSGVMLAFTQPVRLGDRVTVDDYTGIVDEISLSYTALTTDEGRRIFVPNSRMVSTTIVNRSVDDPRRLVTVELPVRIAARLDDARRVVMEAAADAPQGESLAIYVQVGSLTEKTAWLNVVAYAPFGADVSQVASELREKAACSALGARRAASDLEVAFLRRRGARAARRRARAPPAPPRTGQAGDRRTRAFPASPRWIGKYVPQWIGTTMFGRMQRDRLGRALGIEVAAAETRPPAPDRDEPDVDGPDLGHAVEEIGVAGEVDRLRARDDVADRIGGRAERRAAAVVLGWHRADLQVADRERLALLDLDHRLESPLAQEPPEPARDDDGELLPEPLERRQVEVVVVAVRDEDRIHAAQRPRRDPARPPEVGDAVAKQWIGQQPDAVEIDEDRRVPYVFDSRQARNARRSL